MLLYLIRHGIAAERGTFSDDRDRPLTPAGRHKTQLIAKRLKNLNLQFDLILTSPLVRARQTAEILQAAELGSTLEESADLAPEGRFTAWLGWLETWRVAGGDRLALVGHQPDLGAWAETLVWGEVREVIVLKKAGIIGLTLPETGSPVGRCQLFWLSAPKFLL